MNGTDPYAEVLHRLGDRVKRRFANHAAAQCPAHEDRNPSLDVKRGDDGRALIHCQAGCTAEAVCAALSMTLADLFPAREPGANGKNGNHRSSLGPIVATYDYRNAVGELLCQKTRHSPKDFRWRTPNGKGGWIFGRNGITPPLYNLPAILNAREDDSDGWILLVEGEKDCDNLKKLGFVATTSPDGASKDATKPKWRDEYSETLTSLRVLVVCDNDANGTGLAHGQNAAKCLHDRAAEVKIIRALPGERVKDATDWIDAGGTLEQLRELIDAAPAWEPTADEERLIDDAFTPIPLEALWESDPEMREPIIEGLLRRGEVGNLISTSKSFKTFMILGLALCIATGRQWLGRFPCRAGRVLVIDLELQRASITKRTKEIARAMNVAPEAIVGKIDIISLRGRAATIEDIERIILALTPGVYLAIIIDPLYKTYPEKFDENGNAEMTQLYRRWERMAEHLQAGLIIVHHGTKGSQAEKRIVDVGAGASAQSRSADCHMVMREHEQPDAIVFDARVRSFPQVEPMVLRWQYPLWERDLALNPEDLKTGRTRRADRGGQEPEQPKPEPWTVERFVSTFITSEPQSRTLIVARARQENVPTRQIEDLILLALDGKRAFKWSISGEKGAYLANREQTVTEIAQITRKKWAKTKPKGKK